LAAGACNHGGGGGGGPAETSPGTAVLRLTIAGGTYCDQSTFCDRSGHLTIRSPAGQVFDPSVGFCGVSCDTCLPSPCPGIACISQGISFTGEELTWDGGYLEGSTCGASATACTRRRFAPSGHYLVTMCATPGTISAPDGGSPRVCNKTGDRQCLDVSFD